ncbi:reverse transcriptase domain-containing protein [Tanacetum coccineum]
MIIWFLFASEGFKTYGLLKSNGVAFDRGLFFVTAIRNEPGIAIYGSDLIILLTYAPSMPPLRSLPLSMACDDSDGCVTMHQEESARRSTEMEVWIKKLQENVEINTRNQSALLKNLETQIAQLTKEIRSDKTLNSSSEQIKTVTADQEYMLDSRNHNGVGASINVMPRSIFERLHLTNLKKTNMLYEMADMSKKAPLGIVENVLVKIDKFLFPSSFVIIDNTPSETTILGRPLMLPSPCEQDVLLKNIFGRNK